MGFLEELQWRGMVHDCTPGAKTMFNEGKVITGYLGVDPTAVSLTIGNLAALMMLMHFQRAGHKPIALVGGATGMVGDPSGKSKERNLLDEATLEKNIGAQRAQMERLLDFSAEGNAAEMVNNYDWFKEMDVLSFLRDIGKHLTVNYMLAKDSVKSRMDSGISFTEFSYQLIQGYDFKWLYENKGVTLQMGGSDQWGNMTAGTELIRRMGGGKAEVITCPLITKADGTKFGKSEGGNIWLDPKMTSPYKFYQFWLNSSDDDVKKFIRIFTFLSQEEIENLEKEFEEAPHARVLQKRLAEEVTVMIHGREAYEQAIGASQILFGKGTKESLEAMDESYLLDVFDGVPQYEVASSDLENGIGLIDILAKHSTICSSNGDARRSITGNSISINKVKVADVDYKLTSADLLQDKYILFQKGKKNYHLIRLI